MDVAFAWRGEFSNVEANTLHAEAFETRVFTESEWNWVGLTSKHSLGWVTAREDGRLIGFVNVPWDGLVHAWIQDTMVAGSHRHRGIGRRLVEAAARGAASRGCEWLHVDFGDELKPFYVDACRFAPTSAGLIRLN